MITELIDKQDGFEIVRDQIAAILTLESASQQKLACGDAEDGSDWKLRVFTERSNPWEQFNNEQNDRSPIVNIWYDNSNFPEGSGNTVARQQSTSIFNIDCYGYAKSADNPRTSGHIPGDREAAFEVHRAIRLVRNILMAAEYTYLGLRGTVWQRWPQSITVFQPEIQGMQMQNIVGARVALRVKFNELSPQVEGETLELLSVDVRRTEDGEIVLEADYEYPIP